MNPTRWSKISEIVEEALQKPVHEREAYINLVCGNDFELQKEIDSLLSYQVTETDLFEKPQFGHLSAEDNSSPIKNFIGQQIGKYKITKPLGEGGMGAVFLGERADGEFEQKVAIKLLKQGLVSKIALSRFISERKILARLHHRFIAQLIDGGTTSDGIPYLIMEYVEGFPLMEYCREKNLGLNTRLEIFQDICSAVQYAHQHLVIHRDLKPSNIMVTHDGTPKLLDFGISKLVSADEDENQTQTEFRALTPAYASPEQIKGEPISTSSDIYSLGVILYELLTGKRPFDTDTKNFSQVIKMITEDEPKRPSLVT